MTLKQHISDLVAAIYGIIALLEGGLVSSDSYPAAERIIEICKREGARSLAKYDRSLALSSKEHS